MNRWFSEHLFWPLTEGLMGRDTLRRFRELKRSEHLSSGELGAVRARKLRRLLRTAYQQCPFHARRFREAGMTDIAHLESQIGNFTQALAALRRLPLLTRGEIRTNLEDMTWHGCPGGAQPYTTGGSSGEPLKFYFDRARQAADWAARLRARSWWGVRPGDAEILLWGAPVELKAQDRLKTLRDRLLNQRLLNAFEMTAARMDEYIAAFQCYRPACVYGYPSSLALLARHALGGVSGSSALHGRDGGRPLLGSPRLRAVFVTGEVLAEPDRRDIEAAFGAPAVIEYGCRDGGLLACGCPAGRLHVPEEHVIVEVLDREGRPVAPGEIGEVVVTNLECLATPMIRYRTGDLARLADGACPCGRSSMTLLEVIGRKTDQIVCNGPGGLKHMHALALIYVLREADGLRQFRITQRSLDRLDVEIVPGPTFTAEVERAVLRGLQERLGPRVEIRLLRRERIASTASGKHACVVSEVDVASEREVEEVAAL